jgi:hypothetical protein
MGERTVGPGSQKDTKKEEFEQKVAKETKGLGFG